MTLLGVILNADGRPVAGDDRSDVQHLLRIAALCGDARIETGGRWQCLGDPTEGALLVVAIKGGLERTRKNKPPRGSESFLLNPSASE